MPAFLAERLHQALKVGLEILYTSLASLKGNVKIVLNIDGISYFFPTLIEFSFIVNLSTNLSGVHEYTNHYRERYSEMLPKLFPSV